MDSQAFRQITVKFFASLLSDMSSRCDSKEHLHDLHGLLGTFLGFLDRLERTETGIQGGGDGEPSETIDYSSVTANSDNSVTLDPVPAPTPPNYYAVILKCIDAVLTCLVFMLSDAFSVNLPPNVCDSWCCPDEDDELCRRDESTVPSPAYEISDDDDDEGYDLCLWSKCPINSSVCGDDDDKDSYGLSSLFDQSSDDGGGGDDELDIYGLASLFDRLRLDSDDSDKDDEKEKKYRGKAHSSPPSD